jgi:hypothetical protein
MATENPAKDFGNETHDNCEDDARTQQNREGAPRTDGAQDNAHKRAREAPSDQPPTREAGSDRT